MTYIVKQMVRGKPYAYEVEAYWDPVKKQSRQKRKYLGAIDNDGNIIPKTTQRQIRRVKTFGSIYMINELAKGIGLTDNLNQCFGDDGSNILALAMGKMICPTSLKNMHHVLEESFIPEILGVNENFNSQRLSEFLARISKKDEELLSFFRSLAQGQDALIYDITTMSSYSRKLEFLEYGSKYRKTGLPQFNVGLIYSLTNSLPIFYKLFPGSITDVVTLKNMVSEIDALGVNNSLFILDRGFYSESNIEEMLSNNVEFIMPLPFGKKPAKDLISSSNRKIEEPANGRMYNDRLYFVMEKDVVIANRKLMAFIIFNKQREADEKRTLFARIEEIESALNGKDWNRKTRGIFESLSPKHQRFFKIQVVDGTVNIERRPKAITQAANRCGKMILLSSKEMTWDDALTLYRERDRVEKSFNELKNDLEALPARVSNMSTLRGLMFVFFVSLILRSILLQRAKDANMLKRLSTDDILFEMGKLKSVLIGQEWKLAEVSKKQRDTLKNLKIAAPSSPHPR